MRPTYDDIQKDLAMLATDLVGKPLTYDEMACLGPALLQANGNQDAALLAAQITDEAAVHARELLDRGLKLSVELDKLEKRGVRLVFCGRQDDGEPLIASAGDDEDTSLQVPSRLTEVFDAEPSVLFVAGAMDVLSNEDAPLAVTLRQLHDDGCKGIFVADRPFDGILQDKQVATGIRRGDLLVLSDRYHEAASVRPDVLEAAMPKQNGTHAWPTKSVFVSGSRSLYEIPAQVQESLDNIVKSGLGVLIGDSDKGVDRQVADFLRLDPYPFVTVCTILEYPRIECAPEWRIKHVESDPSFKPQQRQMAKDRAMADAADWGLAIFDPISKNRYNNLQVSSGTLRNTIQMLLAGKKVRFFYRYGEDGDLRQCGLRLIDELEAVLESYGEEPLSKDDAKMIQSARGVAPEASEADLAQVKCDKIMRKYRSLLKDERKALEAPKAKGADAAEGAQVVVAQSERPDSRATKAGAASKQMAIDF